MDLLHLVDRLEEMVAGAQKMPIGNRAILDRRRMLDLIDQMRVAIPHEVREAQDIVAERDAIKRDAEEDGRIIVAQAEERAFDLIEEHSITEAARSRAEGIAAEADRRLEARIDQANRDIQHRIRESRRIAREQMEAADEYARELLIRLERQLQAFQNSIRAGVEQLEPHAPAFTGALPPMDDEGLDDEHDPEEPVVRHVEPGRDVQQVEERYQQPSYAPSYEDEPQARGGRGGDLDNLLAPRGSRQGGRQQGAFEVEAEPGVIDDFDHEPLDDDPMLRPSIRRPLSEREGDDR